MDLFLVAERRFDLRPRFNAGAEWEKSLVAAATVDGGEGKRRTHNNLNRRCGDWKSFTPSTGVKTPA